MGIYLGTNEVSLAGTNGNGFMVNGRPIATKTYTLKLSDTNFASITASTATTTLTLPATSYTTTASTTITCFKLGPDGDGTPIDLVAHDYVVFFEAVTNYNYSTTVAGTIHGIKSVFTRDAQGGRYHSSVIANTGALNTTTATYSNTYTTNTSKLLYQKADNTYAVYSTNYGFYCNPTPVQFGRTNNRSYIELRLASVCIRGNDSYFPVTAINALNPTNTTMTCTWYVYEGDKSIVGQVNERALELVTV